MARQSIRPAYRMGLASTPGDRSPESALQTFTKGAVLVASGGFLEEGGANPTAIVGVADEPGQNGATDGAKTTHYTPALSDIVFEAILDSAGALGARAIAATDLWTEVGITKHADGSWYLDVDKVGATGRARIIRFKDPVGTLLGRVFFIFTIDGTIYAAS